MVDAPVSGGVGGAQGGTLTFMVGGSDAAFAKAKPFLEAMGKTIVHAGGAGNGQAAKICNNMMLGVSMIAVSEAFVLAEKLGLDAQKLFDISSKSSGQCWSMTTYCPVPGPVPTSPANRDYAGRIYRRDDAEGSQARAGGRAVRGRAYPARRAGRKRFTNTLSRAASRGAISPESSVFCAPANRDGEQSLSEIVSLLNVIEQFTIANKPIFYAVF